MSDPIFDPRLREVCRAAAQTAQPFMPDTLVLLCGLGAPNHTDCGCGDCREEFCGITMPDNLLDESVCQLASLAIETIMVALAHKVRRVGPNELTRLTSFALQNAVTTLINNPPEYPEHDDLA